MSTKNANGTRHAGRTANNCVFKFGVNEASEESFLNNSGRDKW